MESMLTQWCYVLDISITSNDNDNAIPINQGSIVFKRSLLFFFLPLPFPFSLYEILPLQPRGGESAIRSISLWWSGLGVMMPRV